MKLIAYPCAIFAMISACLLSRGPVFADEFSCTEFPRDLTEADLVARFGPEKVTRGSVFGSDDGPQQATLIFSDDPSAKVEIVWRDVEARASPNWIRVRGDPSQWETPNGISVGMTLSEVEKLNGWPFRLAGFRSGLHGAVRSWGKGRISDPVEGVCTVVVSFQHKYDGTEDARLIVQVSYGGNYSSGHPAMQKLNPKVVSLVIWHRRGG